MPQLHAPVIPEGINLTENDALLNDAFFGALLHLLGCLSE